MLKSVRIKNFGVLPNDEYRFSSGLNVVVGENGLGKTQLLKLIYAVLKVHVDSKEYTKTALQKAYADKLVGVFRPDALGRLVKRRQGQDKCELVFTMKDGQQSCAFSFATRASVAVQVDETPTTDQHAPAVFLPTRELLTLCPWFGPFYDNYHVPFEETWRDTVSLLGTPGLKGLKELTVGHLLIPIEAYMGGKVTVDAATGEIYLNKPGESRMEMPLVAEGLRKMAMLARLISTGILLEKGYLFWDEPESNLNPKLIKVVAESIMHICNQGIQVFVATHSLFLLRELEILAAQSRFESVKRRYFALKATPDAPEETAVEQGDSTDELQTLVLLDEELMQSDRYLAMED
ncbi:AAA family ATPase [Acidithiobacillus ferrivorans]|nr:AAA family ATPase [Acidithiobacillus ferrivorans]